jgi:nitrous oxide reductase accessory protein NosL
MKKFSLLVLSACLVSTLSLSASETYTMNYNKDTLGLVRKMQIYKDPAWVSKVVTQDLKEFYFTSPKSMLEFYYNPEKWPEAKINKSSQVKDIIVTDYKTGKAIDARYAFYVYGSNKISYAGDDLPAFKSIDDAKYFLKHNNGRRVLSFNQLSRGLIELLNGEV